ncbi:MAG: glycosyltransferase [Muribaculaceae bacterium]|nr:glycosyltransferase [Muribaculaceae bacterium]
MDDKLKANSIKGVKNSGFELNNNKANQNNSGDARKLAFYIGSLHKGGAERVFVNLAEYFLGRGYQVVMVTQYQKEEEYVLSNEIDRVISDITLQETTKSRIRNFCRRVKKLHKIWKTEKPDLVLSCVGKNNFMTVVTTMFTKTKAVVSVVGEAKEEYPTRQMRMLANFLFPFAAGVILQTERSRSFFSKRVGKAAVILPNSLNPLFIRPRFEGEREKRIVSVGRLDANKNHEMMIRAFARLSDTYPEYTLTIYGEGELREYLQGLIASLGLEERVFLPGMIQNVAGHIEKAALFLLTSYSEGVSNALIEAMALGLTVIATDVPSGGTEELIRHGEDGWVIPTGDQAALEAAMDRLLSDRTLADKLGRQAQEIQKRLAPEVVNEEWERYFVRVGKL